jgi:hypothetical protein
MTTTHPECLHSGPHDYLVAPDLVLRQEPDEEEDDEEEDEGNGKDDDDDGDDENDEGYSE